MTMLQFSYLLDIQMKIASRELHMGLDFRGEIKLDRNLRVINVQIVLIALGLDRITQSERDNQSRQVLKNKIHNHYT